MTEQGDVRVQLRKSALTIGTIAFLAFSASGAFAAGKPAKKEKAPELPPAKIEDIHVGGVWARAARKGEKTHIFLTIENKGEVPAVLRGGAADVARFSQLVKFSMLGAYLRTEMVGPVPVAPRENTPSSRASSGSNSANSKRKSNAATHCPSRSHLPAASKSMSR